jgi:hypothetical protein
MKQDVLSNAEKYKLGDKRAIMQELHWCLANDRPLPKWLRSALLRAVMRATFFDIDSWDDVFGSPCVTDTGRPARGKTRIKEQKKQHLAISAYDRIERLKAEGNAVDRKLFEKVAAESGVGRALLEKIYYDNRRIVGIVTESYKKE